MIVGSITPVLTTVPRHFRIVCALTRYVYIKPLSLSLLAIRLPLSIFQFHLLQYSQSVLSIRIFPPTHTLSKSHISHPFKILFYNKATAPIPKANKPAAIFGACVSYAAPSEVALLAAPPRREVALPTIPPTPPEVAELSALLALEEALLSALLALLSALLALEVREELFEEKREREREVSYSVMDGKKGGKVISYAASLADSLAVDMADSAPDVALDSAPSAPEVTLLAAPVTPEMAEEATPPTAEVRSPPTAEVIAPAIWASTRANGAVRRMSCLNCMFWDLGVGCWLEWCFCVNSWEK